MKVFAACIHTMHAQNNSLAEAIIKPFKFCRISVATNGSEDGYIHCLRKMAAEPLLEIALPIYELQSQMILATLFVTSTVTWKQ